MRVIRLRNLEGERQTCPFRWPGQYEDEETGLYYNRFRFYDPDAGQYASQDPIGLYGGLKSYAYVVDPNAWIDPFGLTSGKGGYDLKSRIKENPRLARAAEKAGKDQKVQRDLDDLTSKLGQGNLNPGIGTKPIGSGISEARSRDGARVYFRVIKEQIEILGKSSKANQAEVIREILKTFT
jgi:RHS repeat-associated protein